LVLHVTAFSNDDAASFAGAEKSLAITLNALFEGHLAVAAIGIDESAISQKTAFGDGKLGMFDASEVRNEPFGAKI